MSPFSSKKTLICAAALLISLSVIVLMLVDFAGNNNSLAEIEEYDENTDEQENDIEKYLIFTNKKLKNGADKEPAVDPCVDFYEFACGNYYKDSPDPAYKFDQNTFLTAEKWLNIDLETIVRNLKEENGVFGLVKTFYDACMNRNALEVAVKDLKNLFKTLHGGYPTLEENWNNDSFKWPELMKRFREVGVSVDFLFDLAIQPDIENSTIRRIVITQPKFFIINKEILSQNVSDVRVQKYKEFLVTLVADRLGASREVASSDLSDVLEFMVSLVKIMSPEKELREKSFRKNYTISALESEYSWLNWTSYINSILPADITVNETEVINVYDPPYFENLGALLASTSNRTLANYFFTRMAEDASAFLGQVIRSDLLKWIKFLYGDFEELKKGAECVEATNRYLTEAVSALYARKHFTKKAKQEVEEMANNIKQEFGSAIDELEWMDNETKSEAKYKLDRVIAQIGYPDELEDDEELAKYYGGLEISKGQYLLSKYNISRKLSDITYSMLRQPVKKNDWRLWPRAASVTAKYSRVRNTISFRAGILQDHFFDLDRPKFMNYGAIGGVIAHELTHGFDDQGRGFDADGRINNWWNEETLHKFNEKKMELIEQYRHVRDPTTGLFLNGERTVGENIADNGAVKFAYRAYKKWVNKNGVEKSPQDTPEKLFWISWAQNWCSNYPVEKLRDMIESGEHPPDKYRAIIPLRNREEFSRDFDCSLGSPMNPSKKVEVW